MGKRASAVLLFLALSLTAYSGDLVPFNLPWDYASDSVTNVSRLLDKPAGRDGFIRVEDGHFVDGAGKRFRILGVNTAFTGDFPTHEQAERIAARMAKFGINCVRIHHLDTSRAPSGIWKEGVPAKQEFDPERLDRLDYFIALLKANGIYVNLNLKVGRKTVEADGVPHAADLPTYDKGPDHFYPRLVELQKNFARDYLTHQNSYTGTRYVDEPSVAAIEINNESGLVFQWSNGAIDKLSQEYQDALQSDWIAFLREKYADDAALRRAWTPAGAANGRELLSTDMAGWTLEQHEQARAEQRSVNEGPDNESALQVAVTTVGSEGWHVQTMVRNLVLDRTGFYRVALWMRADPPRKRRRCLCVEPPRHAPGEERFAARDRRRAHRPRHAHGVVRSPRDDQPRPPRPGGWRNAVRQIDPCRQTQ